MKADAADLQDRLGLYRRMKIIRSAETSCGELFADGSIPGFIHLSLGQEAISVGIMAALRDGDTIASTHRGHGHALAKGLSLTRFFAELLGRDSGACRGRGGSMHVADVAIGMLGANGIVGAGIPIALGSGLAAKLAGNGAIAVAFFGDGATAEGSLHESLNIAKLMAVPVLFACEANGWSEFSRTSAQIAFSLEALAAAYSIPYAAIDGMDVVEVRRVARDMVGMIRAGGGPMVLECRASRLRGHFEGDPQKYRDDLADAPDPLTGAREMLLAAGAGADEIAALDHDVAAEVSAALEAARRGKPAEFAAAQAGVYAPTAVAA